jgi:hypothetical protein
MFSDNKSDRSAASKATEFADGKDLAFFGEPPLAAGEDADSYHELLRMVTERIKPEDVLETILVRDYVDLQWELQRWRRINTNLISPCTQDDPLEAHFGTSPGVGAAHAVLGRLPAIEKVDRMTALLEVRRNNARRELEHYRASANARPRRLPQQIEDVEFHEIEEQSSTQTRIGHQEAA